MIRLPLVAMLFVGAVGVAPLRAQSPPRDPTAWPPATPRPDTEAERLRREQDFKRNVQTLNPVRIGGGIKPPTKVRDVKPVYPAEAQAEGIQGVVIAEVLLDTAGGVRDVHVLRSVPQLDEAALTAVRQWRFTPVVAQETPRAALLTVTVNFTLSR